ncbi:hypothetical protein GGX14DRAFT_575268 [Mycena pura]|uniref:Uncharacterized protein n=1 Tax=Mycena pura TaxID=153505 RepID=A0AAD6Y0Y6_9AGAR|nr:hypothetical protein GGX14DRAFT_575268 [Mycena pura]
MLFNLVQRALALVVLAGAVSSQSTASTKTYDPNPFNFIGYVSAMTIDNATDPLSGGTMTVLDFVVVVPRNTLLTLPSITCAWSEMFDASGNPQLPGLGTISWEVNVFGNQVGETRIAGLIFMFQESLQLLQGFITSIDYDTGHFMIDNQEAVLNDPLGRYGLPYTDNPLWTVDPDNPSVRATTGFPLCIPRNTTDSECPLTNRPQDGDGFYLTSFTMPDPALVEPNGLDPRIMVPLVVGDYITYSGILLPDGLLAIYSLTANLGIYTAPGTQPAYLTCAAAQFAIVVGDATVEVDETRATTECTDPTTAINWFAMDVDPCTGDVTERDLLLVQPESAAPVGEAVFREGKTPVHNPTRNQGFRYTNGVSPGPRGIVAGQFIQPVFTFVFPELIDYGSNELPNQFNLIPFLALGGGPLEYGNFLAEPLTDPPIVGQLDPWPGVPVPGTTSCAPPASTTASTSTSSSASASSTPKGPVDIVTILSATTRNQKGETTTTVIAVTNNLSAQLFVSILGADSVANQGMTPQGGGEFQLAVVTKGKPTTVTVTSSAGGSATEAV